MSSVMKTWMSSLSGPSTPRKYCLRATAFWWAFIPRPRSPRPRQRPPRAAPRSRSGPPPFSASSPVTAPAGERQELRGAGARTELRARGLGPLEQLRVGLFAPDHVPVGPVQRRRHALADRGRRGADGEARKPAVVGLVQPVAEAHHRHLARGVGHEAVAAGLVAGELLAVQEQGLQAGPRRVVGRRGAARARAHDDEIVAARPSSSSQTRRRLCQNDPQPPH